MSFRLAEPVKALRHASGANNRWGLAFGLEVLNRRHVEFDAEARAF
jgi:hypothetical protein